MDNKLKQYYDKLSLESWIKSGLCGLSIGFGAMFISALAFWLTVPKYFWIALIIFAVVAVLWRLVKLIVWILGVWTLRKSKEKNTRK